ncbi:hypothetical protein WJX84_006870 [Apatococcus fuscideae]|uniref:Non-specific serine/threonine protein kinase n=1 Tax=Apatococcus fuscideae TaxID=2026836 RepID=A0AAW1SRG9_9CHLO
MVKHKRELIKFGWNHLKRDDSACKFYAFLNVCHFLEAYQAPEKIVLQVFVALLRATHADSRRGLVKQALDVLTPALSKRLPQGDQRYPIWVRYTKKVLVEENQSLPHLTHIWQLIVAHPDLFYSSRSQFVPQMINSLSKLSISAGSAPEHRRLTVDLARIIIAWEKQAMEPPTDAQEAAPPTPGSRKRSRGDGDSSADVMEQDGLMPAGKQMRMSEAPLQQAAFNNPETPNGSRQSLQSGAGSDGGMSLPTIDPPSVGGQLMGADGASAKPEEEFHTSVTMAEMMVSCLTRLAFVLAQAKPIDKEAHILAEENMNVLTDALKLWPGSIPKLGFLEKLLHPAADPPPALVTALKVFQRALEVNPAQLMKHGHQQLVLMLPLACQSRHAHIAQSLASVLTLIYKSFPTSATSRLKEASIVQSKVQEVVQHYLQQIYQPDTGLAADKLLGACCAIQIIQTLDKEGVAPEWVEKMTMPVIKAVTRIAREHAQQGTILGVKQKPSLASPRVKVADGEPVQPVYGEPAWIVQTGLRLIVRRGVTLEVKKPALQMVLTMFQGGLSRPTDACVLLEALRTIRTWLLEPPTPGLPVLSHKEAQLFLQRMAQLNRTGNLEVMRDVWESVYLDLLHRLCSSDSPVQPLPTQSHVEGVWDKVERVYLLGLRARDPAMRHRFFELYNRNVPPTLYDRLKYIVCHQDWEAMAGSFWIKHALDLLLAVLCEQDPIKLGPNSAHIAPLLKPDPPPTAASRPPSGQIAGAPAAAPTSQATAALPGPQAPGALPGIPNGVAAGQSPQGPTSGVPPGQAPGTTPDAVQGPSGPAGAAGGLPNVQGPQGGAQPMEGVVQQQQQVPGQLPGAAPQQVPQQQSMQMGHTPGAPGTAEGPTSQLSTELQPRFPSQPSGIAAFIDRVKQEQPSPDKEASAAAVSAGAGAAKQEGEGLAAKLEGEDGVELALTQPAMLADRHEGLPDDIKTLLLEHAAFLRQSGELRVKDVVRPLREAAHAESSLAHHLWVLTFPIVWATLAERKEQQIALAKPIIVLLQREYHLRQSHMRPNVVQSILEGISLSQPQPKIPSELIKFLGKTFNAWHIAIPLLESHVMLFPHEMRCFDALAELYTHLGEEDVLAGLWKRKSAAHETRELLAHLQHGLLERTQDLCLDSLERHKAGTLTGVAEGRIVTRGEQELWTQHYLECCSELHQWGTVSEYASSTSNLELAQTALCKLQDWASLKDILPMASVEETPKALMIRAYNALQEGHVMEGDTFISQGICKALDSWWGLPEVGSAAVVPLLAQMQALVELQESTRILLELGSSRQPDHPYGDLKEIMETWRLRTPNEWERLSVWSDVLVWRNHVYNIVINAFQNLAERAPQLHQLGYRDKAWSVNRLGRVARKHGCPEACKRIIVEMYGFNAMEVQEAFIKICEQAKSHLQQPDQLQGGINLVLSQNLDYFQPPHQAEIFRLKGLLCQMMRDKEGANLAFSTAMTRHPRLQDGWLSWGSFCDKQHEAARALDNGGIRPQPYLENAVACYLQAMRHGSVPSRQLVPRILHLLAFDNKDNVVGRLLESTRGVPLWLWLAWIPQLLLGLQHPEKDICKRLLLQIATAFPQALYYSLRTYLLSCRDSAVKAAQEARSRAAAADARAPASSGGADATASAGTSARPTASDGRADNAPDAGIDSRASGPTSPSPSQATSTRPVPQERPAEVQAFEAGKEVMETLRQKQAGVASILEMLLTEMGSRFVPKPEERLLAVVHALLQRCLKLPYADMAMVPDNLRKELAGVCKACFSSETVSKHGQIVAEYREQFVSDLSPESKNFPEQLGELSSRLKAWRAMLESTVEDSQPRLLHLHEESRALHEQSLSEIEMPGQFLNGDEVQPDRVVWVERISNAVRIVRRHGTSFRRLDFIGSDGHTRRFIVQTGQHWSGTGGASDERMMQLLRQMNRLLDRFPEARRRCLAFHTPIIVPVWPQVRLLEEDASYCSYGEAYEAYKKIVEEGVVTENVFSQFMYKTLPSAAHLWIFKKQFCAQLALSGLVSHMLLLGGRAPTKILFARSSGKLFQMEFFPSYDLRGLLERTEPVPFRLTRNLQTFFTPFGVDGIFITSMALAAQACLMPHSNLQHLLSMFFRDDITAWAIKRTRMMGPASSSSSGSTSGLRPSQLRSVVIRNIDDCFNRLKIIAPTQPPPRQEHEVVGVGAVPGLQQGAVQLVEAALDPRLLCKMDPTWHPWL